MKLSRRGFLRVAGITGTTALGLAASPARASSSHAALDAKGENESAMLVDTTLCARLPGLRGRLRRGQRAPAAGA